MELFHGGICGAILNTPKSVSLTREQLWQWPTNLGGHYLGLEGSLYFLSLQSSNSTISFTNSSYILYGTYSSLYLKFFFSSPNLPFPISLSGPWAMGAGRSQLGLQWWHGGRRMVEPLWRERHWEGGHMGWSRAREACVGEKGGWAQVWEHASKWRAHRGEKFVPGGATKGGCSGGGRHGRRAGDGCHRSGHVQWMSSNKAWQ